LRKERANIGPTLNKYQGAKQDLRLARAHSALIGMMGGDSYQ